MQWDTVLAVSQTSKLTVASICHVTSSQLSHLMQTDMCYSPGLFDNFPKLAFMLETLGLVKTPHQTGSRRLPWLLTTFVPQFPALSPRE